MVLVALSSTQLDVVSAYGNRISFNNFQTDISRSHQLLGTSIVGQESIYANHRTTTYSLGQTARQVVGIDRELAAVQLHEPLLVGLVGIHILIFSGQRELVAHTADAVGGQILAIGCNKETHLLAQVNLTGIAASILVRKLQVSRNSFGTSYIGHGRNKQLNKSIVLYVGRSDGLGTIVVRYRGRSRSQYRVNQAGYHCL